MTARKLPTLLLVYGAATLVHFIHNAEFLRDYPGLPTTWTRAGVYGAWLAMTALGVLGWLLVARRFRIAGLLVLAAYALLGLDSLGHYVVAPLSAHSPTMNATILVEVAAAAVLLVEVARLLVRQAWPPGTRA